MPRLFLDAARGTTAATSAPAAGRRVERRSPHYWAFASEGAVRDAARRFTNGRAVRHPNLWRVAVVAFTVAIFGSTRALELYWFTESSSVSMNCSGIRARYSRSVRPGRDCPQASRSGSIRLRR